MKNNSGKFLPILILPVVCVLCLGTKRTTGDNSSKTVSNQEVSGNLYAPMVSTITVTEINGDSATVIASALSADITPVTTKGICFATTPNPTVANMVMKSTGADLFDVVLHKLEPNTTYYIRAYAENRVGVSYGEELSITTTSSRLASK